MASLTPGVHPGPLGQLGALELDRVRVVHDVGAGVGVVGIAGLGDGHLEESLERRVEVVAVVGVGRVGWVVDRHRDRRVVEGLGDESRLLGPLDGLACRLDVGAVRRVAVGTPAARARRPRLQPGPLVQVVRRLGVHLGVEQLGAVGQPDGLAQGRRVVDVVDLEQPEVADHLRRVGVRAVGLGAVPGLAPGDRHHADEVLAAEADAVQQLGHLFGVHRHGAHPRGTGLTDANGRRSTWGATTASSVAVARAAKVARSEQQQDGDDDPDDQDGGHGQHHRLLPAPGVVVVGHEHGVAGRRLRCDHGAAGLA